jgi:hypothetical protein
MSRGYAKSVPTGWEEGVRSRNVGAPELHSVVRLFWGAAENRDH